jgi:hypothetical protein
MQIHSKDSPMGLFYKKGCEYFSFLHMEEFMNEISCNLLLKINIVAPI